MKTTTIIIAAIFSFQFSALSADNPGKENAYKSGGASSHMIILSPVTPAEADFSDAVPDPVLSISSMAPETPAEADFNDIDLESETNAMDLSPETPPVANFDEILTTGPGNYLLVPVAPAEADFE